MKPFLLPLMAGAALFLGACASGPASTGFPHDARAPNAAEVGTLVGGKTLVMTPKAGNDIVLDHGADGSLKATIGSKSDTGTWHAEDGRVCYKFTTFTSACNDVRLVGDDVYFRRSSGEVVKMKAG